MANHDTCMPRYIDQLMMSERGCIHAIGHDKPKRNLNRMPYKSAHNIQLQTIQILETSSALG
jgi:hypothetical protein